MKGDHVDKLQHVVLDQHRAASPKCERYLRRSLSPCSIAAVEGSAPTARKPSPIRQSAPWVSQGHSRRTPDPRPQPHHFPLGDQRHSFTASDRSSRWSAGAHASGPSLETEVLPLGRVFVGIEQSNVAISKNPGYFA